MRHGTTALLVCILTINTSNYTTNGNLFKNFLSSSRLLAGVRKSIFFLVLLLKSNYSSPRRTLSLAVFPSTSFSESLLFSIASSSTCFCQRFRFLSTPCYLSTCHFRSLLFNWLTSISFLIHETLLSKSPNTTYSESGIITGTNQYIRGLTCINRVFINS